MVGELQFVRPRFWLNTTKATDPCTLFHWLCFCCFFFFMFWLHIIRYDKTLHISMFFDRLIMEALFQLAGMTRTSTRKQMTMKPFLQQTFKIGKNVLRKDKQMITVLCLLFFFFWVVSQDLNAIKTTYFNDVIVNFWHFRKFFLSTYQNLKTYCV